MNKQIVWMWQKLNTPVHGAKVNHYCYETTQEGYLWLAEIEEDQMFEPETFEVDPDPSGSGYKDIESMREYLNREDFRRTKAKKVGYVEDGKLYVTKRIKVETGWGGFNSYDMFPTSIEYIYPNAPPKQTKVKGES